MVEIVNASLRITSVLVLVEPLPLVSTPDHGIVSDPSRLYSRKLSSDTEDNWGYSSLIHIDDLPQASKAKLHGRDSFILYPTRVVSVSPL